MRAVQFEEFGEPADVLSVTEAPPPQPQPGEVCVRMIASPVNPSDLMTIRGVYGRRPELPATPGYEGVGVVEASGGGLLGKYLVGKRVAALNGSGGNWAEHVVIPAKQAIPLASDLPWEQAAMFFVNPAAAWVMTRRVLCVPSGEWLLQTAAGSALGRMVVRLGRRFGFRTLNVIRSTGASNELQDLGANAVIVYDGNPAGAAEFQREVRKITNGEGVKYAIDPVGGGAGSAAVGCLAEGGRMLVYGTLSGAPLSFSSRELMTPGARIEGFWLARWMQAQGLFGKLKLVRHVTKLIRAGVLASEVGESFPLDQIADAVKQSEQPGRGGKVLLQISDP